MPTSPPTSLPLTTALDDERAASSAALRPLAGLADEIATRLGSTRSSGGSAVPYRVGDYWYFQRRIAQLPFPIVCRRRAGASWEPPAFSDNTDTRDGDEVLVDGNALAASTGHSDVAELIASPDGRFLAYTVDTAGAECYDLVVLDTAARGPHGLPEVDRVSGVAPRFAWWPDGTAIAYSTVDATLRPDAVRVHQLGTPPGDDVLVHREADPRFWVGVGPSTSGALLFLLIGSATTTEWRLLTGPAQHPGCRTLLERHPGVRHQVDHLRLDGDDLLLVLRSERGQPDVLQVMGLDDGGSVAAPRTLLSGGPGLQLLEASASAAALVVNVREEGQLVAQVYRTREIDLGQTLPVPLITPSGRAARPHDWRQPHIRVTCTSWTAPTEVVDLDVATGHRRRRRVGPAPLSHEASRYCVERLTVPSSHDGAPIPLTVLSRADTGRPAPLLLAVYGAYGQCQDPWLDLDWLELLDRGMRVAVAHVRGGGERGPTWHDAARGADKARTFDDFLDCARHLVAQGWTSAAQLIAQGASAGGLVVAVAANRAPSLFAGIVAQVPYVDPLTSMLDPLQPLTNLEHDEWGDPLRDLEVRAAMQAYSPYQNVREQPYPPMYVTAAEQDWRVPAEHVLRWVGRVRERGNPRGPVLLRPVPAGGHAGPSDPQTRAHEQSLMLAWVLRTAGAC